VAETPLAEPGESAAEAATRIFLDHRELLFAIVYNMLGSVADAEDVLQETWLAWVPRLQDSSANPIGSPRAYLVRMAVNRALARQETIRRRREDYWGPWLPEPVITGEQASDVAEAAEHAESVSIAMLVVLETLTPLERAVFVLHEVFAYNLREVAGILDRSPAATRQIAHRAREHVQARRPRFEAQPQDRREVTERFMVAAAGGDLGSLLEMLAPDVILWADGGGKAPAAGRRTHRGRDLVARLLVGGSRRVPIPALSIRYCNVNGGPAALVLSAGAPYLLASLDLDPGSGQVRGVYVVTNPDKLAGLRRVIAGQVAERPPST
jgi:RNA polymerase sigma factor (sigma-70 family)